MTPISGLQPFFAIRVLITSVPLLFHPQVRLYAFLPFLINVLLFATLGYWAFLQLDEWITTSLLGLPGWLVWLEWLLSSLLFIALATIALASFSLVAALLASPFNSLLAERVEQVLGQSTDSAPTFEWRQFPALAITTLAEEWRKLRYFLVRALIFLVLILIPGVNLLAAPAWLAFGAWMLTLQYADYALANRQMRFVDQRKALSRPLLTSISLGFLMMLITIIPILNLAVVPLGVIMGTVYVVKGFESDKDPG